MGWGTNQHKEKIHSLALEDVMPGRFGEWPLGQPSSSLPAGSLPPSSHTCLLLACWVSPLLRFTSPDSTPTPSRLLFRTFACPWHPLSWGAVSSQPVLGLTPLFWHRLGHPCLQLLPLGCHLPGSKTHRKAGKTPSPPCAPHL